MGGTRFSAETAYGGGGAGTSKDYTASGGSGVFIVRYGLRPPGTLLHLK